MHVAITIPAAARMGLHVAAVPDVTHDVATAWMESGVEMPLLIADEVDVVDQGVADFIRDALDVVADEVVVVAGRLHPTGHWHRLLHDGTAAAIARAVAGDDRVTSLLVSVATSSQGSNS